MAIAYKYEDSNSFYVKKKKRYITKGGDGGHTGGSSSWLEVNHSQGLQTLDTWKEVPVTAGSQRVIVK